MTRATGNRARQTAGQAASAGRERLRRGLMNLIATLTVNAAIILDVPRSTSRNPAPIVLQLQRPLIDDRWEDGEYVAGTVPMVAIVLPFERHGEYGSSEWIVPN